MLPSRFRRPAFLLLHLTSSFSGRLKATSDPSDAEQYSLLRTIAIKVPLYCGPVPITAHPKNPRSPMADITSTTNAAASVLQLPSHPLVVYHAVTYFFRLCADIKLINAVDAKCRSISKPLDLCQPFHVHRTSLAILNLHWTSNVPSNSDECSRGQ